MSILRITNFYVYFKDYDWLGKFFVNCFQKLRLQGRIEYSPPFATFKLRWGFGLEALSKFITKVLGTKEFKAKAVLEKRLGVPISVIHFLIRNCGVPIEKLETQIDYIYLGRFGKRGPNPSFAVIAILHNSPKALAPYHVSRTYSSVTGVELSPGKIGSYLKELSDNNYLSRRGPKGAPYFTLRGEEEKFKTVSVRGAV